MAKIYNTNSNTLLSGTSGKDTIKNCEQSVEGGNNVKIYGKAGNDVIESGSYFRDENFPFNFSIGGNNVTIDGGAGNDSITNYGWNTTISGGACNDLVQHNGWHSTIIGGKGTDIISLGTYARNNVIKYTSGDGNDTIFGFNSDDTLNITKGTYSTLKSGNDFIITVGQQKITLKDALADSYNKINIKDSKNKVSVYNDWKIRYGNVSDNQAKNVTLAGSELADSISNLASNVLMTGKFGNDSITNHGDNGTIDGGKGNDSIINRGADNASILGGIGNDSIDNNGYYATIDGGVGNDLIENYSSNVTISGGNGNDVIHNHSDNIIISGDKGDDELYNTGSNVTIKCGAGNDTIHSYGGDVFVNNVTISGGKGNDYISLSNDRQNVLVQYANDDGNDTISAYGDDVNYILHITKGNYKISTKNNDVIVTVGTGKITLKNAKGQQISIKNSKGTVTTKTYGSSSSNVAELFAENNFAKADNISDIVAEKVVAEFENNSEEKYLGNETLITFAK